jgi:hypothetical protein
MDMRCGVKVTTGAAAPAPAPSARPCLISSLWQCDATPHAAVCHLAEERPGLGGASSARRARLGVDDNAFS